MLIIIQHFVALLFRVCLEKKLTSWNMQTMTKKYVFFAVCYVNN